ncbi:MAG: lytic murein transglycosylase B [Gammaproteobacteria bacterium]|nr:lytic murein transglycosylase B [Gammaproteobacteria bacterium]
MKRLLPLLCLPLALCAPPLVAQDLIEQFPEVRQLIDEMAQEHQFEPAALQQLFRQVAFQPKIIEAISRPAESKPWYLYRPIFLTEARIRGGVAFWQEHSELLARAEREYGVPAHIIVAIIGVETFYGRHKGSYRVLDALSTLGFGYPQRSPFFRGQIKEFLLMAREEQRDPLSFLGSYAGAMGMPQFIPSSFRHYAVDFDQDGRRDLWENPADIIGSVANYFHRHHWRPDEPVTTPARGTASAMEPFLNGELKPSTALDTLQAAGIEPQHPLTTAQEVSLLALDSSAEAKEYWITLHNFYVITRYNRSPLYAMAVHQLSEAIASSRAAELRKSARVTG